MTLAVLLCAPIAVNNTAQTDMDSISSAAKLFTAADDVGRDRSPGKVVLAASAGQIQSYFVNDKVLLSVDGVVVSYLGRVP